MELSSRQHHSHKGNQPRWLFTSANRFAYEHVNRAATSPGPGSYVLGQAVGPQFSSTKTSAPMPGFGTSNRDQMQKVFISTEHVSKRMPQCPALPSAWQANHSG